MKTTETVTADVVVRRAIYNHFPQSAFLAWKGRDQIQAGHGRVDFQRLCDDIVADLAEAGFVTESVREMEQR